mmetsp:Transcript_29488/g.26067  ORF Transcript_29488/g.26067 Transcript_29488/m.26067 type:complete len:128 (+) Transcript_29488:2-385(+)
MDKKKKEEIRNKINKLIVNLSTELKTRGVDAEITLLEIQQTVDKYTLELALDIIKKSKDLYYDETRRIIKKRKKYPIADLKSFEEYIMSTETGLVVTDELFEQYEGIEDDIHVVKTLPNVRVIQRDK